MLQHQAIKLNSKTFFNFEPVFWAITSYWKSAEEKLWYGIDIVNSGNSAPNNKTYCVS